MVLVSQNCEMICSIIKSTDILFLTLHAWNWLIKGHGEVRTIIFNKIQCKGVYKVKYINLLSEDINESIILSEKLDVDLWPRHKWHFCSPVTLHREKWLTVLNRGCILKDGKTIQKKIWDFDSKLDFHKESLMQTGTVIGRSKLVRFWSGPVMTRVFLTKRRSVWSHIAVILGILSRSSANNWKLDHWSNFKGSSDPSHFIFEISVGQSRIRHRTIFKLNSEFLDRLKISKRWLHSI